jgi:hypothetical protein
MWSNMVRRKNLYVLQISLIFFMHDMKFIHPIRTDHPKKYSNNYTKQGVSIGNAYDM